MTGGQKRRKSEDIDRARVSRMEKSAEGSMPGTGERERERQGGLETIRNK